MERSESNGTAAWKGHTRTEMECVLGDMPSCGDRNEAEIKHAGREQLAGKENYRTKPRGQSRQIQPEKRRREIIIAQSLSSKEPSMSQELC